MNDKGFDMRDNDRHMDICTHTCRRKDVCAVCTRKEGFGLKKHTVVLLPQITNSAICRIDLPWYLMGQGLMRIVMKRKKRHISSWVAVEHGNQIKK